MATYKRFEDLPAWNEAINMAVSIFKLTARDSFRSKGDLVNQSRRAALSVSNNIAEGFERGSTSELITFLYIARGSVGEVRSMMRFALALGDMAADGPEIRRMIEVSESVSRQIRSWLDSLQNSDIQGQRRLNDDSRREYSQRKRREAFNAKLSEFSAAMDRKNRGENMDGELKEIASRTVAAVRDESYGDATDARDSRRPRVEGPASFPARKGMGKEVPKCPECRRPMVKRKAKDGKEFWGCPGYPKCHGSRSVEKRNFEENQEGEI